MTLKFECNCSNFSAEWSLFSSTKNVKARKEHQCCECLDTIKKGERYQRIKGCWDGNWDVFETCLFCAMLRKKYCPDGYVFESLADDIESCLGFDYREVPE